MQNAAFPEPTHGLPKQNIAFCFPSSSLPASPSTLGECVVPNLCLSNILVQVTNAALIPAQLSFHNSLQQYALLSPMPSPQSESGNIFICSLLATLHLNLNGRAIS